jgi:hypothetical protein
MRREAYRGLAGEIVATVAPHSESDPVGLLLTTLTLYGGYVGASPYAMADGSRHHARLYTVLVGKTSRGRKGTAHANIARILEAADRRFAVDRIFSGLASGEGLIAAVSGKDADPRAMVFEPEYARLLRTAQRKGSTLSAIVRDAWDRGRLQVTTRNNPLRADHAHVAIAAHITSEELRRSLADVEAANGYANRFLYALVRRSKRLPEGGALTDNQVRQLGRQWQQHAMACRQITRMHRTPAAKARWGTIYDEIDDDVDGMLGAVTARAEAQMLRLQVTYALLDATADIDVCHVEAAYAVWDYCQQSAAIIWGQVTGDTVADRLHEALVAAGRRGLDGTAQRNLFSGHVAADRLDRARQQLEWRGLARTVTEQTGGRPRVITYAAEHAPFA